MKGTKSKPGPKLESNTASPYMLVYRAVLLAHIERGLEDSNETVARIRNVLKTWRFCVRGGKPMDKPRIQHKLKCALTYYYKDYDMDEDEIKLISFWRQRFEACSEEVAAANALRDAAEIDADRDPWTDAMISKVPIDVKLHERYKGYGKKARPKLPKKEDKPRQAKDTDAGKKKLRQKPSKPKPTKQIEIISSSEDNEEEEEEAEQKVAKKKLGTGKFVKTGDKPLPFMKGDDTPILEAYNLTEPTRRIFQCIIVAHTKMYKTTSRDQTVQRLKKVFGPWRFMNEGSRMKEISTIKKIQNTIHRYCTGKLAVAQEWIDKYATCTVDLATINAVEHVRKVRDGLLPDEELLSQASKLKPKPKEKKPKPPPPPPPPKGRPPPRKKKPKSNNKHPKNTIKYIDENDTPVLAAYNHTEPTRRIFQCIVVAHSDIYKTEAHGEIADRIREITQPWKYVGEEESVILDEDTILRKINNTVRRYCNGRYRVDDEWIQRYALSTARAAAADAVDHVCNVRDGVWKDEDLVLSAKTARKESAVSVEPMDSNSIQDDGRVGKRKRRPTRRQQDHLEQEDIEARAGRHKRRRNSFDEIGFADTALDDEIFDGLYEAGYDSFPLIPVTFNPETDVLTSSSSSTKMTQGLYLFMTLVYSLQQYEDPYDPDFIVSAFMRFGGRFLVHQDNEHYSVAAYKAAINFTVSMMESEMTEPHGFKNEWLSGFQYEMEMAVKTLKSVAKFYRTEVMGQTRPSKLTIVHDSDDDSVSQSKFWWLTKRGSSEGMDDGDLMDVQMIGDETESISSEEDVSPRSSKPSPTGSKTRTPHPQDPKPEDIAALNDEERKKLHMIQKMEEDDASPLAVWNYLKEASWNRKLVDEEPSDQSEEFAPVMKAPQKEPPRIVTAVDDVDILFTFDGVLCDTPGSIALAILIMAHWREPRVHAVERVYRIVEAYKGKYLRGCEGSNDEYLHMREVLPVKGVIYRMYDDRPITFDPCGLDLSVLKQQFVNLPVPEAARNALKHIRTMVKMEDQLSPRSALASTGKESPLGFGDLGITGETSKIATTFDCEDDSASLEDKASNRLPVEEEDGLSAWFRQSDTVIATKKVVNESSTAPASTAPKTPEQVSAVTPKKLSPPSKFTLKPVLPTDVASKKPAPTKATVVTPKKTVAKKPSKPKGILAWRSSESPIIPPITEFEPLFDMDATLHGIPEAIILERMEKPLEARIHPQGDYPTWGWFSSPDESPRQRCASSKGYGFEGMGSSCHI